MLTVPTNKAHVDPETLHKPRNGYILGQLQDTPNSDSVAITSNLTVKKQA